MSLLPLGATGEMLDGLLLLLHDVQVTHYASVAAVAFYVYDYVLTFGEEYEYFWQSPWGFVKALFIWNRYFYLAFVAVDLTFSLQNTFPDHVCKIWGDLCPILIVISSASIEFLLSYRVWALYQKTRVITIVLIGIFVVEMTAVVVLSTVTILREGVLSRPGPFLAGCFPTNIPHWFWTVFIPPAVASALLFFLTAAKTVQTVGTCRNVAPLMTLFLRDGVVYFAFISITLSINIILFLVARPALASAGVGFCYTIPPLFTTRILLNVRRCHARRTVNVVEHMESVSAIPRFAITPDYKPEGEGLSPDSPSGEDAGREAVQILALREVVIQ
ncbi:hypothetical protein EXIGLDRAFT_847476 [Exidia glandulosa HHB12029]|uniref:DUF6533 domain-containing protein n=1 Tax=Exidia glandulosa HHB12029 TaxID=1314781 RepID=A0A166MWS7_EXIGL|nr:hypothetical protein EXIGLDRAFT_847476 [Exidia glandulosa HHB12029]